MNVKPYSNFNQFYLQLGAQYCFQCKQLSFRKETLKYLDDKGDVIGSKGEQIWSKYIICMYKNTTLKLGVVVHA